MKIWIDAQLSPALAPWINAHFEELEAQAVRELGLREAEDAEIFEAARRAGVVVMTKDSDFVELLRRLGAPPRVLWIRSGNTSNAQMRAILTSTLRTAVELLGQGETLVEITTS